MERVVDLTENLSHYHACFFKYVGSTTMETGATDPYFEVLALCRRCGSASRAIDDDNFFYWLEKTLKAWQMNRGREGGSLVLRGEMKRSFRTPEIRRAIAAVETLSLADPMVMEPPAYQYLLQLMWSISITTAQSKLVANSKTLHFLMPNLVPPIDRRYTLKFFFNRDVSPDRQREAFDKVYGQFHQIALQTPKQLKKLVNSHPFATSDAKVIDNAIIGYCLETGIVENAGGLKHV